MPDLPFGHLHPAWKAFLASPGSADELRSFSTHWTTTWDHEELRAGYVVLRAGAIGPHFLTNDEPRQCANTRDLVLGVSWLIEFATCFYTLPPGNLLYTGTKARAR